VGEYLPAVSLENVELWDQLEKMGIYGNQKTKEQKSKAGKHGKMLSKYLSDLRKVLDGYKPEFFVNAFSFVVFSSFII